jgi:hypothetical protein
VDGEDNVADRNVAIKSIVAAMDSMNKIQTAKNELQMNLLLNNKKAQDNFLMEMEQKKQMMPLELEQKEKEAQITQKYKTPTMSYKDSIFDTIKKKPKDQWEPWESSFFDSYTKSGEQEVIDPTTGEITYARPRGSVFKPTGKGVSDTERKNQALNSTREKYLRGEIDDNDLMSELNTIDPSAGTKSIEMLTMWKREKQGIGSKKTAKKPSTFSAGSDAWWNQ